MSNAEEIDNFLNSIFQLQDEEGSWPILKRVSKIVTHPILALVACRYLLNLPVVRVDMTNKDRSVARWLFDLRRPGRYYGFVSSYVELPFPLDRYWQGTAKQNLRTRARNARAAGFEVRAIESSRIIDVVSQVFQDKGWEVHNIEADLRKRDLRKVGESLSDAICVAVFDPDDRVVSFCVGTRTGDAVRTLWSVTSIKGPVRWLCFSGYVQEVSAQGGRILVDSAPWALTGGNKIFAGHLGFKAARIRSN